MDSITSIVLSLKRRSVTYPPKSPLSVKGEFLLLLFLPNYVDAFSRPTYRCVGLFFVYARIGLKEIACYLSPWILLSVNGDFLFSLSLSDFRALEAERLSYCSIMCGLFYICSAALIKRECCCLISLNSPLSLRLFCFDGSAIDKSIALAFWRSPAKEDYVPEIIGCTAGFRRLSGSIGHPTTKCRRM